MYFFIHITMECSPLVYGLNCNLINYLISSFKKAFLLFFDLIGFDHKRKRKKNRQNFEHWYTWWTNSRSNEHISLWTWLYLYDKNKQKTQTNQENKENKGPDMYIHIVQKINLSLWLSVIWLTHKLIDMSSECHEFYL